MAVVGFKVGGAEHEYVRVEVLGANGDGWLPSNVAVRVGAYTADYPSDLDCWAFSRFHDELQSLYQRLVGTATFSTYERQLELTLTGDGLGHMAVAGVAMDSAGTGHRLTFRLQIDQTDLPRLISEVDEVVTRYPPPAA